MVSPEESAAIRQNLIRSYKSIVGEVEQQATDNPERAYGGVIRSTKGKLVENMATEIVSLAWRELGGDTERLTFGDTKRYHVPINSSYIRELPTEVRREINANKGEYSYPAQVDVHVFVDKKLVMGVECKSYAENAMLKRILVDFQLLTSMNPNLICCLLQLESMLGGDYSAPIKANSVTLGSRSSHTLMSYFPDINLNIITLLEGERRVDRPIHTPGYFKEMEPERLNHVIDTFKRLLRSLL